jgi:hypothetical protein
MAFSNPVVAGGILQVTSIESTNFVEGESGWIIERNGDAEFNNLTIRGTFFGIDFEINSKGIFFYSSAPANGNLVISLAATAGSDEFGNPYPAGLQILNHGGANASGIAIGYSGTTPLLYFLNAVANITNDPSLFVDASGAGTAQFATLVINSAEDSTQLDYIGVNLDASNESGTHFPAMNLVYIDPTGAGHTPISGNLAGMLGIGSLYAVTPGTGTSRTNVFTQETWHTMALAAGFTTSASDQVPRFRKEGIAGGTVRLDGTVYTSGAVAAGATIANLGAAYAPTQRKRFTGVGSISGNSLGAAVAEVTTAGLLVIGPAASGAAQQIVLDGFTYPLD